MGGVKVQLYTPLRVLKNKKDNNDWLDEVE